ncbi:MAG: CpaF family protein [Dehalococcoidia bacterium]|nr:MAG: CpaF family protein [Dehalococcoidia bacterium]
MAVLLPSSERERTIRAEVQEALRQSLPGEALFAPGPAEIEGARRLIAERIAAAQRAAVTLSEPPLADPDALARRLLDDLLGLGPLQPLLDDPTVEEIIINGPQRVFVIREGRKQLSDVLFDDDDQLLQLVRRALGPLGRRLDEASPMVDARLADGSRLNAVIPPLTSGSPHVTIRKFLLRARTLDDLVGLETLSGEAAGLLQAAVQAGLNILISGGTGSGKTTCLNALAACISGIDERVVTIEETAELQLEAVLPDCVALEARFPNMEGAGAIAIRALVKNALRMRPTRIVVGEVRGSEALDMLTAMNSGHDGSMCTIHANGPREALGKLRTYALMADEALPAQALTEMIAEAVQLVVHLRMDAVSRRRQVSSIYEVTGLEGDAIAGSELFRLEEGALRWSGIRPRREQRLAAAGYSATDWSAAS